MKNKSFPEYSKSMCEKASEDFALSNATPGTRKIHILEKSFGTKVYCSIDRVTANTRPVMIGKKTA
jgi:hypothetical protein